MIVITKIAAHAEDHLTRTAMKKIMAEEIPKRKMIMITIMIATTIMNQMIMIMKAAEALVADRLMDRPAVMAEALVADHPMDHPAVMVEVHVEDHLTRIVMRKIMVEEILKCRANMTMIATTIMNMKRMIRIMVLHAADTPVLLEETRNNIHNAEITRDVTQTAREKAIWAA